MTQNQPPNDELLSRSKDHLRNLAYMHELERIDIDAGRVDEQLVSDIRDVNSELEVIKQSLGATSISSTWFRNAVSYSSANQEFFPVAKELDQLLDVVDDGHVVESVDSLLLCDTLVGQLFSRQLEKPAKEAFGESVTSILYSLLALKKGEALPLMLDLNGGDKVKITQFTFDHSIEVVNRIIKSISTVSTLVDLARYDFMGINVEELESDEFFGIFRLTDKDGQQVLRKVRVKKSADFDDAIEFGGCDGAEPSIGFVIDEASRELSQFKSSHRSPLSVRIDNEGDTLALDIGSVLSEPGTLDKEAADLIAIGDSIRSGEIGKKCTLHHNSRPFINTGLEKPEIFEAITGKVLKYLKKASSDTQH
jgi:hypothetical protein